MNREEKIELAIEKGITYNAETGEVFGVRGKLITRGRDGYINISIRDGEKIYHIGAHQFIWYCVHGKVVDEIDHINGFRDDNRIENLRSVTRQQNQWNRTKAKGYSWHKISKKWISQIMTDSKSKHIGYFDTEQEASQAYQEAKEKYHKII